MLRWFVQERFKPEGQLLGVHRSNADPLLIAHFCWF